MPGFAVLDLETTGFAARLHDRIAEVAVVLLDEAGEVEDEWCTLVNPQRDLGPQHVHGITAADAALAPVFDDVAPALARRLAGRVLVAHNASFDTRFLRAELARTGLRVGIDPLATLCTMQLAGTYLGGGSRSLAACCAAAGVVHDGAHSALGDARATAGLLRHYLALGADDEHWDVARRAAAESVADPSRAALDLLPEVVPVQRGASRATGHWLASLPGPAGGAGRTVDALTAGAGLAAADGYVELLDLALLDLVVSASERAGLLDHARRAGLTRPQVEALHVEYLAALAETWLVAADLADPAAGLADGGVVADLHTVAGQLGLDADDVGAAVDRARTRDGSGYAARPEPGDTVDHGVRDAVGHGRPGAPVRGRVGPRPRFALARGDQIVFTGSMSRPRDEWEDAARAAGLLPWAYVTRRTRLVVAADPDSLSTKARTARRYGVPVIAEAGFERLASARTASR